MLALILAAHFLKTWPQRHQVTKECLFFQETTGWGFGDYLRDLRLERAARLLRETTESMAAVAHQTGFADQSHLTRLFKAKHGVSPLHYRKRHLGLNGDSTAVGELFK